MVMVLVVVAVGWRGGDVLFKKTFKQPEMNWLNKAHNKDPRRFT
jgi:hypothetical protein